MTARKDDGESGPMPPPGGAYGRQAAYSVWPHSVSPLRRLAGGRAPSDPGNSNGDAVSAGHPVGVKVCVSEVERQAARQGALRRPDATGSGRRPGRTAGGRPVRASRLVAVGTASRVATAPRAEAMARERPQGAPGPRTRRSPGSPGCGGVSTVGRPADRGPPPRPPLPSSGCEPCGPCGAAP